MSKEEKKKADQPVQPTEEAGGGASQSPPADEEPRSCQHTPEVIEEARKRWEEAHRKKPGQ
ncbi:MAG TPA: hypothetical protein VMS17_24290 [Gemmataceae bacterium]|nr:hypothetical protein [Gemmataceae bacterium]